jgi:metal-responsive CopG/Arc/MetJ family transcriptional regulator
MTSNNTKNKENKQTKISLWINNDVLDLISKFACDYDLSRSDFIRLAIREALVNRGLLPRETEPLFAK